MDNNGSKVMGQKKRDPWFSLEWFKWNTKTAEGLLTFYGKVHQLLNPTQCRIKVSYTEKKATFYQTVDVRGESKWVNKREIKLLGNNRIKVGKRRALSNPYVWALAVKLKFFDFEPVWEKIEKWHQEEGVSSVLKKKDDKVCLYVLDKYGNHAYLPLSHMFPRRLDKLYEMYTKSQNSASKKSGL